MKWVEGYIRSPHLYQHTSKAFCSLFKKIILFTSVFILMALGLHCCSGFSLGVGNRDHSSWDVWASHCSGFSCWIMGYRAREFQLQHVGLVAVASQPWSMGSVGVVHGLSHSAACGVLQDQGSKLCPLLWQADSLPLSHQGSPSWYWGCFYFSPSNNIGPTKRPQSW